MTSGVECQRLYSGLGLGICLLGKEGDRQDLHTQLAKLTKLMIKTEPRHQPWHEDPHLLFELDVET